ncbi:MAG: hypothetical protein MJE77_36260 [Proteobacteria bacterium]|nr:hypothetical protein [Pseudomonadota bacterium]
MKQCIRFTRIVGWYVLGLAMAACAFAGDGDGDRARASGAAGEEIAGIASLPSPLAFVSQLDLECRKASGPPLGQQVFLRQLNPVLQNQLPNQMAAVGELREVCLPVAKNHQIPGPQVLRFIRWVDLACYEANAAPVDVDVTLSHLNPVLAGLPDEAVHLAQLRRLCVPVRKNNSQIPWQVRRLIRHLDLACYRFEQPTDSVQTPLILSHLNPVVREMGFDDRQVLLERAFELCVPVGKNNQPIPDDVLHDIEWVDLIKYQTEWISGEIVDFALNLTHLNPLFAGLPQFEAMLTTPLQVLVPVAKNQQFPPAD